MTVQVLLFGPYADMAGQSRVSVDLPAEPAPTAQDVLARIGERHPPLQALLASAVLAVNCSHVPGHTPVEATDELAVIGLVNGG